MIVGDGLGDDTTTGVPVDIGVSPNISGVLFTLAIVGGFAFLTSVFSSGGRVSHSEGRKVARQDAQDQPQEYRLEVDVTGRGTWQEQATGSLREVKREATQIRNKEGMKTRLVPL